MNLLEMTHEAINQVGTYLNPDLDNWKNEIDNILSALGENTIGGDKVENIGFYFWSNQEYLEIKTSYSVRCCEQSNEMHIPIYILESENPIKEARRYFLSKELEEAKHKVNLAQKELERTQTKLAEITKTYEGEIK